jgi:hypothetical protein
MFVNQKAQEIGLALIRIAVYIRRLELRSRIESLAMGLLENTAAKDWENSLTTINVLNAMVNFGKLIYQIEPINANIILQELNILNSAIRQIAGLPNDSENIAELFSKLPVSIDFTENKPAIGNSTEISQQQNNIEKQDNIEINVNGNGINANIRQSEILEKIRQLGQVFIKDLIAEFPDVSERTLRYDLQKLCNQNLIERVGNSGPSTYYVIRNKVPNTSL